MRKSEISLNKNTKISGFGKIYEFCDNNNRRFPKYHDMHRQHQILHLLCNFRTFQKHLHFEIYSKIIFLTLVSNLDEPCNGIDESL